MIAKEQSRLTNSESLHKTARVVGKPFWEILITVLEDRPDGLSGPDLFQEVTKIRPVAIGTIRNLLSRLPCFYQKEPGSGVWLYDPVHRTMALAKLKNPLRSPSSGHGSYPNPKHRGSPAKKEVDVSTLPCISDSIGQSSITSSLDEDNPRETEPAVRGAEEENVSGLIVEGVVPDKALIRDYLSRYHGIEISEALLNDSVPPPESIREARQAITAEGLELEQKTDAVTVRNRVKTLLADPALRTNDNLLILAYYARFHNLQIPERFLEPGIPTMETIPGISQKLTNEKSMVESAKKLENQTRPRNGKPGYRRRRRQKRVSLFSVLAKWLSWLLRRKISK